MRRYRLSSGFSAVSPVTLMFVCLVVLVAQECTRRRVCADPTVDDNEATTSEAKETPSWPLPPFPPQKWPWETDDAFAEKRRMAIKLIKEKGGVVSFAEDAADWWSKPASIPDRPIPSVPSSGGESPLIYSVVFAPTFLFGEVDFLPEDVDDDVVFAVLPYIPELKSLNLNFTRVTNKGLAAIADLRFLEELSLSCDWSDREPSPITDEGMKVIGMHPSLRWAFVQRMPITDCGVKYISRSRTIERLVMNGCPVTSECFVSLADMPMLGAFSCNRFSPDSAPESHWHGFAEPISSRVAQAMESLGGRLFCLSIRRVDAHPSFLEAVSKMHTLKIYLGPPLPTPSSAQQEGAVTRDRSNHP